MPRRQRVQNNARRHLDHASICTTSDRYGHLSDAAHDRLRDHLEATYTSAVEASASRA